MRDTFSRSLRVLNGLIGTSLLFILVAADGRVMGADDGPRRPSILERRPCGPDSLKGPLRYLLFQGCAGADFRASCVRHDLCYDTPGSCKRKCDEALLQGLLEESSHSKFPLKARFRAHFAYLGVRWFGNSAWKSAQKLAVAKANSR